MDNSNAVGLKITTDTKQTVSMLEQLINKLDKTNQILDKISINKGFEKTNKQLKDINNNLKMPNLTSYLSSFKRLGQIVSNNVDASASYLENLNLMQVAYGDTRKEAERFIDKISDTFGLNESTLTRQLGYYRQIGNALSIDNDYAELLASNLLKMQLDVSSLYNLSFERSGEVLQSSMAGQTKPIRGSTGGDITQGTLQTDLDRLGIDRQVSSLNRSEKAILIYLSLERQLVASQQDLAKTINSTANQQKIFSEQTQRLATVLGHVLTPAFTKLLTWANGLLMVINELVGMFAIFVGFEMSEYDPDSYKNFNDLTDYLDNATGSAGKLKKELNSLRGWDKLNAIITPKDSSFGVGGTGLGGVDNRLLNALKEYDLGMDSIHNKATKIRDAIMEWLGFTYDENEAMWKFDRITLGTVIGSLIGTGGILWGANKILGILNKIGLVKYKNIGELAKKIGDIFKKIKQIEKIVGKDNLLSKLGISGATVTTIGIVAGVIADLVVQFWSYNDIWKQITEKQSLEEFFKIDGAKDLISTIFTITGIMQGGLIPFLIIGEQAMSKLDGTTSALKTTFDNCKETIVDFVKKSGNRITSLYEEHIKPTVDDVKRVYNENIKPLAKELIEFLDETFMKSGILKSGLGILVEFVGGAFSIAFQTTFGVVKSIVEYALSYVEGKIIGVTNVLRGSTQIISSIAHGDWASVWNGMKNMAIGAFQGMTAPIRGIINSIISMAETLSNSVVTGVNSAIGALNKLKVKIPNWVPKYGGKEWGISINKIPKVNFPRLETGIDFVPKDFYGPVYLDYGERVLTKEENQAYNKDFSIRDEFINNLRQSTFNGMMDALAVTSQNNQNINVTIVAEDDGILNNIKFKQKQHDRQFGF